MGYAPLHSNKGFAKIDIRLHGKGKGHDGFFGETSEKIILADRNGSLCDNIGI